jgi:ABC-2 type transport system permease protein
MNTMKWLVKREYWEHKGGFFWAPVIAACIYICMSLIGILVGEHVVHQTDPDGFHMGLVQFTQEASDPNKASEVSNGVQMMFQTLGMMPLVVTVFVVFFYCLGSLYDERKDKSVLFWKSLPISDRDTIVSKVISATVVAPVIGTVVAIATSLTLFVIASIVILIHGQNPAPLWNISGMLAGCLDMIATIPITALWALPTIGYLMMVSSWARTKPFLWATLVPIIGGVMIGITGILDTFRLGAQWYWSNVVGRALFGLVPWMEKLYRYHDGVHSFRAENHNDMSILFSIPNTLEGLANPQLWIGAVVGVAMIVVAIRMRRWRDEG